jgi:hypothetical protein
VVSGAESRLAFSTEQAATRSRMGKTCLVIESSTGRRGQIEGHGRGLTKGEGVASIRVLRALRVLREFIRGMVS